MTNLLGIAGPTVRATKEEPLRNGLLLAILSLASGLLRFRGLGASSLWLDELCTWHVSRLPLGESLAWAPESTIPPLYQWLVRLLAPTEHPAEWLLRLPAWAAGTALAPAAYFLTRSVTSSPTALAAAGLVAIQPALLRYSQEARPYTLLVLAATLSTAFLFRLVRTSRWRELIGFVLTTTLGCYSHLLMLPVTAAQALWFLARRRSPSLPLARRGIVGPLVALGALTSLVWIRAARFAGEAQSAVDWIELPTFVRAWSILAAVSYGPVWAGGLLVGALAWIAAVALRSRQAPTPGAQDEAHAAPQNERLTFLMLLWLMASWLGLLVVSWLVRPLMVERYALAAAIPAIVLPMLLFDRVHRHLPAAVALAIIVGTAPEWGRHGIHVEPGLRELVAFLDAGHDSERDMVVLVVDHANLPSWDEAQLLPFDYYRPTTFHMHILHLDANGQAADPAILKDPRRLNLIVFRCDGAALIARAGRTLEPIEVAGQQYTQLPFGTHRLLRAAERSKPVGVSPVGPC